MNDVLRNTIGRAAYEAALGDDLELSWSQLTEEAKEVNRRSAEAAVEMFVQPFLPVMQILATELLIHNPAHKETIQQIYLQATGKELKEKEKEGKHE